MGRKIKFRAWDNQEKRILLNGCIGAGSSYQLITIGWDGGLTLCNAFGLQDGTNPSFDLPVTERFVMLQFTGLTDMNGKEIYEGDILEGISNNIFSQGDVQNYEVIWGIDHWHISGTGFSLQELFNYCNNKIKVIGNIYETPKIKRKCY